MPNIPTVGVFIPNGYLNLGSSAGPSGQQDAYGNIYPSGLCPGKVIEVSASEAASIAAPGTALYDGAYQYVLLDSGATASLATQGYAAYIKLDSGATQGALPMTEYENGTVTTADVAGATDLNFLAGVFVNPATFNGQSNAPTPGQYCFLFVGAGRAVAKTTGSAAVGNQVVPTGTNTGLFTAQAPAVTIYESGVAMQTGTSPVVQWPNLFYRISNQGV